MLFKTTLLNSSSVPLHLNRKDNFEVRLIKMLSISSMTWCSQNYSFLKQCYKTNNMNFHSNRLHFFMFDPCRDEMLTFDLFANIFWLIHWKWVKLYIFWILVWRVIFCFCFYQYLSLSFDPCTTFDLEIEYLANAATTGPDKCLHNYS